MTELSKDLHVLFRPLSFAVFCSMPVRKIHLSWYPWWFMLERNSIGKMLHYMRIMKGPSIMFNFLLIGSGVFKRTRWGKPMSPFEQEMLKPKNTWIKATKIASWDLPIWWRMPNHWHRIQLMFWASLQKAFSARMKGLRRQISSQGNNLTERKKMMMERRIECRICILPFLTCY